uniref:HMA domain-containing protein n=1 Tax=Amorphochlora amoebiformis TaxID=1561963 RepID=A0A7S0D9M3_9EUKA|mmetsp:Transcript_22080/g.34743  ORF Transcript_22080/g.34743 Transcript_22080/m.34743 type:complete len:562 (+) Transcript_22080:2-1687(+)
MEATRVAGESAVAKLVSLVEKAQASRAPIEKTINSIAHWYTPAVVIVAVGLVIFDYSRNPHGNHNGSINQALVLLVTACPCALLISTPVTYVCAMAAAAKSLVLVKGGEHLETIAVMKNMALDKTGTLTKAAFSVSSFSIPNISDRLKVLRSVLAVESVSTHPIATALSLYIETQLPPEGKESKDISDFKIVPGKGVESTFEGSRIFIGNNKEKLLDFINSADSGDPWMKAHTELNQWAQDGKTTGVVWINDFPKAYYAVSDIPRTGAKYTVEGLWTLGVQTRMLTGDAKGPARVVGRQIGMNDDMIMSQLLPEDKIRLIRAIKNNALKDIQDNWRLCAPCSGPRKAKLAMVGDGVNDAPAMAAADVAIAMGANGAALAMETADVVLMDSEILKLVWLVKLSRAARRTIIGNITFSIAVKLIVLTLVAFQRADLWMAIFADVGSMLAVTINSTLLLTWESSAPKEKQKRAGRRGEDNKAYGSYGSFDSRKVGGPGTCERGFRDNGENGLELRGFQYSGNESNLEPDLELQGFQYGFSNGSPSNKSDEKELTFDNLVDDLFA